MRSSAEALVLTGPETLERRSFEVPDITDDTARLRIEACGLCGTDHEQFSGHIAAPFSFIPGHEIIGVIDEIGPDAAARWGVDQGDRVAVEVFRSCRQCEQCASGKYRRCVRNGLATMFGFVDAEIEPGLWGGYATHLHLPSDSMLLPIPDQLDAVLATVFNPLGAGIRWGGVLRSRPGPGRHRRDHPCRRRRSPLRRRCRTRDGSSRLTHDSTPMTDRQSQRRRRRI